MSHQLKFTLSYRSILQLIFPMSIALLIPQTKILIDNLFYSYLGLNALAIGGITSIYFLIFSSVSQGFNNGVQNLMSHGAGQNTPQKIGVIFNQSIIIALFISFVGIGFTYFITPFIFKKFLSPEIEPISTQFVKIEILTLPLLLLYQLRTSLFIVLNNTKWLVLISSLQTLVNFFLDWSLIFGHCGLPALGVVGAAWASIIAQITGVLLISYIHFNLKIDKFIKFKLKFKIYTKDFFKILKISLPIMLQFFLSIFSFEIFLLLINKIGIEALSISNIMSLILSFVSCFVWAASYATISIVSNLIGQYKKYQIIIFIKKLLYIIIIGCSICIAILLFFKDSILALFNSNQHFINDASPTYYLVCFSMFISAIARILMSIIIGFGKTLVILLFESLCFIIYICYSIYL
ncbi:MAG: MATE family efflux transporter, partial [Alphaproteobacteria bacterium]|nr:MATE family efflux transporter [Alphaproteobacteria bacterium]